MRVRHLEAGHPCVNFEVWIPRERLGRADFLFLLVKAAHLMRDADGQHLGWFTQPWELRAARFLGVAV